MRDMTNVLTTGALNSHNEPKQWLGFITEDGLWNLTFPDPGVMGADSKY